MDVKRQEWKMRMNVHRGYNVIAMSRKKMMHKGTERKRIKSYMFELYVAECIHKECELLIYLLFFSPILLVFAVSVDRILSLFMLLLFIFFSRVDLFLSRKEFAMWRANWLNATFLKFAGELWFALFFAFCSPYHMNQTYKNNNCRGMQEEVVLCLVYTTGQCHKEQKRHTKIHTAAHWMCTRPTKCMHIFWHFWSLLRCNAAMLLFQMCGHILVENRERQWAEREM